MADPETCACVCDESDSSTAGFAIGYVTGSAFVFYAFGLLDPHRHGEAAYLVLAAGFALARRRGLARVIGALLRRENTVISKVGTESRTYAVFQKQL